jgi:hypothetical protein
MTRSVGRGGPGTIRSAVVDHGNPAVMHGAKATTAVSCKDDGEVLDGLMQVVPSHDFTFGRFMGLADAMECKRLFSVEISGCYLEPFNCIQGRRQRTLNLFRRLLPNLRWLSPRFLTN